MSSARFLPDQLYTSRLTLRRYSAADSEPLRKLVAENRAHLIESFSEMAHGLATPTQAAAFVDDKSAQWLAGNSFCFGIWREESKALVGQIQAKHLVWNVPSAELSYFIASDSLRRGFASEAIRSLLQVLFERLEFTRVSVRVVASNVASLALAKALGFHAEGLHRQEFRCGLGNLHDVRHLSMLRTDPRPVP